MLSSRFPAVFTALLLLWSAVATAAVPIATTEPATQLTTSSALLNGTGRPNGEQSTGYFRIDTTEPGSCDDSFGTRVPASGGTDLGAGSSEVDYSITASGLVPGTTYWFCALVTNASGTDLGQVLSFTVPAPPVVVALDADPVTATSATLRGAANPLGSSTTLWFRYSATDPGVCNDSFGTRTPSSSGTFLGSGSDPVDASRAISSLTPGTTYYVCAIADNAYGTSFSEVATFTTDANPPTVSTSSPTALEGTTATFRSTVNAGGASTTAWFRYGTISPGTCNDSYGTREPSTGGIAVEGTSSTSVTVDVESLTPGTTYYICALAENSAGLAVGSVVTTVTPLPPTVETLEATSVTNTTATLPGLANPNRASTMGWFRYSSTAPTACNDTFGSRAPTSGGSNLGSGTTHRSFNQSISGLSVGDTYYFCAIAESTEGLVFGEVRSFTTDTAPMVLTQDPTAISTQAATLSGSADPNGSPATGWFRYSDTNPILCNDSFGTRAPSSSGSILGSGSDPVDFTRGISSLQPGATYWYCALASNSYDTAYGEIRSFTTPAALPTASTSSASPFTGTTATLRGSSNPNGAATGGWFRYSTTSPGTCNDNFGTRVPETGANPLGSGNGTVSFTDEVEDLTPGETYYYCAIAENSEGQARGSVVSFTTALPATVTTHPATSLTNTSATLQGRATPNRAATTGWFRYSATAPTTCNDTFGSRAPLTGGSSLGSGTSSRSFNQSITGLTEGATYWYCAIVESSEGMVLGEVLSFTTLTEPLARTDAASNLTPTSAVLAGTGNPRGSSATGWFRYDTTNPGTCTDSFGSRAPSSSGSSLGSDTEDVAFTRSISSLTPGETYWYCAITSNSYGTAYGAMASFTTPTQAPTASTSSASPITGTTANLRGSSNAGGAATLGWFRYATVSPGTCNDTYGTRAPATGGVAVGSDTRTLTFEQSVTGLVPGTTYYACAFTSNANGSAMGSVVTFTTPLPPEAITHAATSIGNNSATLQGRANPNRAATSGWFRYAPTAPESCNDTFGSRAPVTGADSLGSGTSERSFNESISGLTAGVTYWYCAIASSAEGTSFGEVLSFTTVDTPGVSTEPATEITTTTAVLNGTGDPNGDSTTGWFRYDDTHPGTCNDSFGSRAPSSSGSILGAADGDTPFSRSISGLQPGQTWYFCAITSNAYGTAFGPVLSFSTPVAAPSVSTNSVPTRTSSTATLRGSANPNGGETVAWLRYSTANPIDCNDTFGTRAPAMGGTALGDGNSTVSFEQPVTGLAAGTTYYVCALGQNASGVSAGSVVSFTTPLAPEVTTNPTSSITSTGARLNGAANPNLATTTGWFRYSNTEPESCDDLFGARAPTTGGSSLGSGTSDRTYSQSISGLSPDTTYYGCAIASSAEGVSFGEIVSFTTLDAPVVRTLAATPTSPTTATFESEADPNGTSTTVWYRYSTTDPGSCSDSFGNRAPSSSGSSVGFDTEFVTTSRTVSGLTPGRTYYVCAVAENIYGTSFGAIVTMQMPPNAPTVSTSSATTLTGTGATLRGSANPQGSPTGGWFRYATISPGTCNDTFGTRAPATSGVALGDGNSTVAFEMDVTGLSPGTTYYACAIAQNAVAKDWGSVVTFTTPLPPDVLTLPASSLTNSSARLQGSATANRAATTGWFRYSFTEPDDCDDLFGSRAPVTGGRNVGTGTTPTSFNEVVSGLSTGTTYWYCAIAESTEGLVYGEVLSFTTLDAPVVVTSAATQVSSDAATLNGGVNANGSFTTAWYRYDTTNPGACSDGFGLRAPTSGGTSIGSGNTDLPFSRSISNLTPGTTYWFCAIAESSYGTSYGPVLSFTTPATEPTVRTLSASLVTSNGADINGTANPNGASTVAWFRYHTSSPGTCNDTYGTRTPAMGGVALGDGTDTQSFAQTLDGLAPGTTYYVCAIAQNAIGLSFGSVVQVTTRRPPEIATLAATPITSTTATLNASGTPNGNTTTGWFRFDTSNPGTCGDGFGTRVPASGGTNLGSGSNAIAFDQDITGLSPGTTYFVCAIGESTIGVTYGEVLSFTTPATAPTVTTLSPSSLSVASAQLEGAANPNGAATLGWFRYSTTSPVSCDDNFGTRAPATGGLNLGTGTGSVSFSRGVGGLAPNTTYHYCAIAENSGGIGVGTVLSFTTPATCASGDADGDGVCDDADRCDGDDATGDGDLDGICDDVDVCDGDDTAGDTDADGICDDIDFQLATDALVPGGTLTLTATHAPPGDNVFFFLSTRSPTGSGPCGPSAPTVCLDISAPTMLGNATADASGTAVFTVSVPANLPPAATAWFQAAYLQGATGDVTPVAQAVQ